MKLTKDYTEQALDVLFRASLMVLVYCPPHFQCQNEEKTRSGSEELFYIENLLKTQL